MKRHKERQKKPRPTKRETRKAFNERNIKRRTNKTNDQSGETRTR